MNKRKFIAIATIGTSLGYMLIDSFTIYKKGMFVIILLFIALVNELTKNEERPT